MIRTFAKLGKIASENLYFHKKDRELIQKSKESNLLKEKRDQALQFAGHCTCCGEKADLQNWQGVTVAMCNSCEHVSISLEGLDDLMTRKKLKNIVVDEIISRREVLSEEEFEKLKTGA